MAERRELKAETVVEACLKVVDKDQEAIASEPKAAPWKVAIAGLLRQRLLASNAWLAHRLNMGVLYAVSRYVGELQRGERKEAAKVLAHLNAKVK